MTARSLPPRSPVRLLAVPVLLLAAAGCSSPSTDEPRTVAQEFASLATSRPDRACALLAPATRADLEKTAGQGCTEALPDLDLPSPGTVFRSEVDGHSAQVRFASDTVFLARFDDGWRITAAGCVTTGPDLPYDCDVKAG